MLHASLRRSGGSFIMTIPQSYVDQNHLEAGARLAVEIVGDQLKIRPTRAKHSLDELLAAMPAGLCRVQDWDEMGAAGAEL